MTLQADGYLNQSMPPSLRLFYFHRCMLLDAISVVHKSLVCVQIHTTDQSTCPSNHKLVLSSSQMADVFITTLAELPGLILAALLIDVLGRKRCVTG